MTWSSYLFEICDRVVSSGARSTIRIVGANDHGYVLSSHTIAAKLNKANRGVYACAVSA